jgi:hypothetical protein
MLARPHYAKGLYASTDNSYFMTGGRGWIKRRIQGDTASGGGGGVGVDDQSKRHRGTKGKQRDKA